MTSFVEDAQFLTLKHACEANADILRSNFTEDNTNQHGKPWALNYTKPELDLEVYSSAEAGSSLTRFMAKCRFKNASCFKLIQVLNDVERRMTWDTNLSRIQSHHLYDWEVEGAKDKDSTPNNLLHIFLVESRAVGPISARDFVDINYLSHQLNEDGEVISVTAVGGHTSELTQIITRDYADIFPEKPGFVRGVSSSGSGWFAVQQGEDVLFHYVIHSDLKGYFPAWLANNTVGGTYVTFFQGLKDSLLKTPL